MPIEVQAILCDDTRAHFHRGTIPRRDCGPKDVLIDIHYAGICHSDYHSVKAEWGGPQVYPYVPGHEIAGVVEEVGPEVTKFKKGDRVGVGCMVDSCRDCESCKAGFENYCLKGMIGTYGSVVTDELKEKKGYVGAVTYGGYSEKIVVDEDFVCTVPKDIPLEHAAPLLCAGITMYSPLALYGAKEAAKKKVKVGIVGLGGLGDMGVKIAKAFGCEVTAISSSERKRNYAENTLGVKYINSGRTPESLTKMTKEHNAEFDLIVCTISADFDINSYLLLTKPAGTFCIVGAAPTPLQLNAFTLIGRPLKLCGSLIGGMPETQEMLEFCAKHQIWSEVEHIHASETNRAYTDLGSGNAAKQRFVIDMKDSMTGSGDWEVSTDTLREQKPHTVSKYAKIIGAENTAGKTYYPKQDIFKAE